MKIRWNSDAAQEMLEQLRRAQQSLDDGMGQARRIDINLENANAQGDDEALTALAQRLSECRQQLTRLAQQLSDFRSAANRADAEFEDTERGLRSKIGELETGRRPGYEADYSRGAGRGSTAYGVMPRMRTQGIPLPGWLNRVTAGTDPL